MLSGEYPFASQEITELIKGIKKKPYNKSKIQDLSKEAKNLIDILLEKNPSKRVTIRQILEHPWFTNIYVQKLEYCRVNFEDDLIKNIQKTKSLSFVFILFFRLLITFYINKSQLVTHTHLYYYIDYSLSGFITVGNLEEFFKEIGFNCSYDLVEVIHRLQFHSNEYLSYTDVLIAVIDHEEILQNEDNLEFLFRFIDVDKSQSIDYQNFKEVFNRLGYNISSIQSKEIKEFIGNSNVKGIDFQNFKKKVISTFISNTSKIAYKTFQ